jgi:hypothetical protein
VKLRVVDTNVLVVANGRVGNAGPRCRLAAIDALNELLTRGRIVVDLAGEILGEYRRYCKPEGQPGVGDRFFREVLMNYAGKIERVCLKKRPDGSFVDFPDDEDLANFDHSDRKFAAASRKLSTPVVNATDSDWVDHLPALERHGIRVDFVCGMCRTEWFK